MTVRGIERRAIFADPADYRSYLGELRRSCQEYACTVLAYALMPNHVHLVVQDPGASLSAFMQSLNSGYARYVNHRYRRVGHLYQGRFHSKLVAHEPYLLHVTRYVHLNPVRAGLVANPEAYPWSSYCRYIGLDACEDDFVAPQFVLALMGGRTPERQALNYRQFVECRMLEELPGLERKLRRLKLLGRRMGGTSRAAKIPLGV